MFLLLPYSAELKLTKKPYITYAVVLLCVLIFYLQDSNRSDIEETVNTYCESIQTPNDQLHDDFKTNPEVCKSVLTYIQLNYRGSDDFDQFVESIIVWDEDEVPEKELISIRSHYESMQLTVPEGLDMQLMYYPDTLNPFKMITSALSHADFWHIFGNLLFFIAFAPPLEILINNRWQYLKILLSVSIITSLSYSIFSIGTDPIPSLGLSGVVMGMIGLSAYMMPNAKIRCFLWIVWYAKVVYIPAWILAAWYIGWDTYDLFEQGNNSGINLVAHVSGGIAGYLLGRLWFKQRREEYQYELDEEINYQRYKRIDKQYKTSSMGGQVEYANRMRQKFASRDYESYMQQVYNYASTERDSDAIILILEDYEIRRASPEIYEEIFQRIEQWKPSRTLLCLGRLIINLLIQSNQYGKSVEYVERCQKISKGFVLADPNELILLVQAAIKLQKYELAYLLINDASNRYKGEVDSVHFQILEIKLLWYYLGEKERSMALLKKLIQLKPATHLHEIDALIQLTKSKDRLSF